VHVLFTSSMQSIVSNFRIDQMMRYSLFVPRLYNLCRSLGFEAGNIMPSRAFCSDENQGFPIILIAKHFGAFPFNHGRVGGIVATDRHGPHANHGKDMVIIQASHVGYDPEFNRFGQYRRLQSGDNIKTDTCGKIALVLQWYLDEYRFAQQNIYLGCENNIRTIKFDKQLLNGQRTEGLFPDIDNMVKMEHGKRKIIHSLSTSQVYQVSDELNKTIEDSIWPKQGYVTIGELLSPEMFVFKRLFDSDIEGQNHLENNLLSSMPWIVTSVWPILVAAQVNVQFEFDRTFRSIAKAQEYRGKRLLYISCLNIDISPQEGQLFPLTKCIPWAAYIQNIDGTTATLEQSEIIEQLMAQSTDNADQIDLEIAIQQMIDATEVKVII